MSSITFDEFKKVEIRIGKILSVEKVENADKLLKLEVEFSGEIGKRQIVSGIAEYYSSDELVDKKLPFIVNLEPRKFKGIESQGMLLAVQSDNKPILLVPDSELPEGSIVV